MHIGLGLVVFCCNCVLGSSVLDIIIPSCRGDLPSPRRVQRRRSITKVELLCSFVLSVLVSTVAPIIYAVEELTQFGLLVVCCVLVGMVCGCGVLWAMGMHLLENRCRATTPSPPTTWIRPASAPPQDRNNDNNNYMETVDGIGTNDIELGASQSDEQLSNTNYDHLLLKRKVRLSSNPPPTIPNESDIFLTRKDTSSSCRTMDEEYSCGICLSAFLDGEDVAWTRNPACPHAIHLHCIYHWCETAARATCPMCRRTMAFEST